MCKTSGQSNGPAVELEQCVAVNRNVPSVKETLNDWVNQRVIWAKTPINGRNVFNYTRCIRCWQNCSHSNQTIGPIFFRLQELLSNCCSCRRDSVSLNNKQNLTRRRIFLETDNCQNDMPILEERKLENSSVGLPCRTGYQNLWFGRTHRATPCNEFIFRPSNTGPCDCTTIAALACQLSADMRVYCLGSATPKSCRMLIWL